MRRSDREITELSEIINVMDSCDVVRVAFKGEEYPYVIPLNFGMELQDEHITLYFHGAKEGLKYHMLELCPNVCFEMDCNHRLIARREECRCSMDYASVIGFGTLSIAPEEERFHAIETIMEHYHEDSFPLKPEMIAPAMEHVQILKLTVESLTGKLHIS